MQKEFYHSGSPRVDHWEGMWSSRAIEQEQEACEIESPPRDLFLRYLREGDRVLEAGCGFGKWLVYLARRGYDVTGIDSSELAVRCLKEFDASLQVEVGDVLHTGYPDGSFDAYISMGVVEHFEEGPMDLLREAHRVLKPGGLAFLSVPTVNLLRRVVRRRLRNGINALPMFAIDLKSGWAESKGGAVGDAARGIGSRLLPEAAIRALLRTPRYRHFTEYRYTADELEGFLRESGFDVLETVPHDFYGSRDHSAGLAMDFPFLAARGEPNFRLTAPGRAVSRLCDSVSPWIACSSALCLGVSLRRPAAG